MAEITLGLDLGANSIGWALLDQQTNRIVASGVRVFPEGVDAFDTGKEKSRTQDRRIKRGMRRQIARRARRKGELLKWLTAHGLLPGDPIAYGALIAQCPYQLRAKGLDHALTLHEFGRVLLHLNARRGFLSNSKSDKTKAKETSDMLKEINDLANEIETGGFRTLGEYLASQTAKPGEKPLHRVRGKHTLRDMLRKEFDVLWSAQQQHHPAILTDALKTELDDSTGDGTWWMGGKIFGQRNLYWPASMIGRCEYEPRERRCPKAERIAQRYRLLSEINNLKYVDSGTGKVQRLDETQRALLFDHLSKKKEMPFDSIRKLLGMVESVKFNLEKGERSKLKGHIVDYVMAKDSPFAGGWWKVPEARKNEIVHFMANPRNSDDAIVEMATRGWGFSDEQARLLLGVRLPVGYLNLSRKAIEKILPHMEKGLLLMTDDDTPCALTAAGYLRPDQRRQKRVDHLPPPPEVANPVVRQALFELRRVVNAIIREHGVPSRIHIELARNIRMGPDDREKYNKARQEREDARDAVAADIRAESPGARLSRDLLDKCVLWKDQGGQCVYSGRSISLRQLLAGEIEVDHILPRWRSLDDSFANKVVCFREMNREKRDRTPFEWLSGDPERFDLLKQRVRGLSWRKRIRFTQESINTEEFANRQLVDTAYITRVAADYMRCLVEQPHHVLGGKGTYTAELRHLWGIETILSELPDSPAWAAQADLRPGKKNRADHRHHAIDAVVVALTDQRRLQALSRLYKTGQAGAEITPWEDFRSSVKSSIEKINVSHRVQRRVSGALHEETIYGKTENPGEFVVRKPLESLTPAMAPDIRDRTIRKMVEDRLSQFGIKPGRKAGTIPKEVWKDPLLMSSGIPIKKVRIIKRDETIRPLRGDADPAHVKPGSMHHLCIFEYLVKDKLKREAVFVTTLEATERLKRREPVIQRVHPSKPQAKFLMSLSAGEMTLGPKGDGRLMVFNTAASTQGQIYFHLHSDARPASEKDKFVVTANSMSRDVRKITVDPLGRIRWAND